MGRRILTCLLLAAAVLALPSAARAVEEETVWECRERAWDEYAVMLADDSDAQWEEGFTRYGDQLTGDALAVYQKLETAFAEDTVELAQLRTEDGSQPAWQVNGVLTATIDRDSVDSWWSAARPSIMTACMAFTYDHPEYFWIRTNYGAGYSWIGTSDSVIITACAIYGVQPTCDTLEKRATQQSQLDAAVQPILAATEGMPTVARVAYFENWLAANNTYNSEAAGNSACLSTDDTPWSAVGALVDGYSPVCEGYAKAFQLLCHRIGVPCVTVSGYASGGNHMWAAVRLDGTWYFCDPTFDDPIINSGSRDYSTRNYFLTAAKATHTASMSLTPPPLSGTGYFSSGWAVSGGSITGGEQTSSDASMGIALYDSTGRMLQYGICTAIRWGSGGRMYVAPELDAALVKSAGRIARFCVSGTTGAPLGAAQELLAS